MSESSNEASFSSGPELRYSESCDVTGPSGLIADSLLSRISARRIDPDAIPINPSDPFTGRILASSIPPPHEVATLKRCFIHAEGFYHPKGESSELYGKKNPSAQFERIYEGAVLSILASFADPVPNDLSVVRVGGRPGRRLPSLLPVPIIGPDGSTPDMPYAVVFEDQLDSRGMQRREEPSRDAAHPQDFWYYQAVMPKQFNMPEMPDALSMPRIRLDFFGSVPM
ncbi:hypothetical protein B0H16DRAFT_1732229 [Mycena metata]|uniref:Uncharacterized protein n=1 Tax=Mycena metata TaxID=1033252 RepID=A0AAD7MWG5_9AGAR|nr:hypothetical protein B0H16DRAFT_1732229 [Mycena metata]